MAQSKSVDWITIAKEFKKRWLLLTIVGVYVLVGGLFALLIFRYHWDQPMTRLAARVYPLPAAKANGDFVWLTRFYDRLAVVERYGKSPEAERTNAVPEDPAEQKRKTLDQLIERKLLEQEADRYGVSVTEQEVQERFRQIAEANKGEENFKKVLAEYYGLTPIQFAKEYVPEGLYKEKLRAQLFTQVHARYIIVQDSSRANEVIERLKKGEDFGELAKNFSQDTKTREQGGDLGFIQRGQHRKEVEDAAFALEAGKFTEAPVVVDGNVFIVIKVDERKDGPISDKSFTDWLTDIHTNATVTRYVAQ